MTTTQISTARWLDYSLIIYDPATVTWNAVSGVYAFAGRDAQGIWRPLYIGQADTFRTRPMPPGNHERWAEAVRLGATHVHALTVPLAAMRDLVERRLIAAYQPPLNIHHRSQ
jgi:hypothetical protein